MTITTNKLNQKKSYIRFCYISFVAKTSSSIFEFAFFFGWGGEEETGGKCVTPKPRQMQGRLARLFMRVSVRVCECACVCLCVCVSLSLYIYIYIYATHRVSQTGPLPLTARYALRCRRRSTCSICCRKEGRRRGEANDTPTEGGQGERRQKAEEKRGSRTLDDLPGQQQLFSIPLPPPPLSKFLEGQASEGERGEQACHMI